MGVPTLLSPGAVTVCETLLYSGSTPDFPGLQSRVLFHTHTSKKMSIFLVHVAGVLKKTVLAVRLAPYAVGRRPPALS